MLEWNIFSVKKNSTYFLKNERLLRAVSAQYQEKKIVGFEC